MTDSALSSKPVRVRVESGTAPSLVLLRLFRPTDDDIFEAGARLGVELDPRPNRMSAGQPRTSRIAPGDWLIEEGPSIEEIRARLAPGLHHASDALCGRTIWSIEGPGAAELINAGCGLDLRDVAFPPGSCTRTLLAQIVIWLRRPTEAVRFEIICERPLAAYLAAWLADAAAGLNAQPGTALPQE